MSLATQSPPLEFVCRLVATVLALVLGVSLVVCGWKAFSLSYPADAGYTNATDAAIMRKSPSMPVRAWSVFWARGLPVVGPPAGELGKKFQLVGTFTDFLSDGPNPVRRAVLRDLRSNQEHIVEEHQVMDDVLIVRIQTDSVRLRGPAGEEEIRMGFSLTNPGRAEPADPRKGATTSGGDDRVMSAVDRFGGRQMGERSWVFKRDHIMRYYRELRDDPERLVRLFDSFQPEYRADGRITGYCINIKGEGEFLKSVGLKEGDIVRRANQIPMTRRTRAEFLIREFIEGRANVLVLEVERGGKTEKLVYQVQ